MNICLQSSGTTVFEKILRGAIIGLSSLYLLVLKMYFTKRIWGDLNWCDVAGNKIVCEKKYHFKTLKYFSRTECMIPSNLKQNILQKIQFIQKFKMGNRMQPTGTVRMVPRRIIYRIRLIHLKPGGKTCQEKRFFGLIFSTMIIQLHS